MVVAGGGTLRYAISNLGGSTSTQLLDAQEARRLRWRNDLERWAFEGINFVQLREKSLPSDEVFALAETGARFLAKLTDPARRPTLLINGRPDIAAAAGADGVHLTAQTGELRPEQVRAVFRSAGLPRCIVSVSTHSVEDVTAATQGGADLILFGPVFEKRVGSEVVLPGTGLSSLERACRAAGTIPVLALGGVDEATAPACLSAGAAGIAAIRLFSA